MTGQKYLKKAICFFLNTIMIFAMIPEIAFADALPENVSAQEWDLLKIVNAKRIEDGLKPLSITPGLQKASKTRVGELITKFSKTRPNGNICYTALGDAGITYSRAGENMNTGAQTASQVFDSWMNSLSYKDNLLSGSYQHVGIGYSYSETAAENHFWQQFFIGADDNSFSNAKLSTSGITINAGDDFKISDSDITLEVTSSKYGAAYLPVLDEMCTGFTPNKAGVHNVTVSYGGLNANFTITVKKPDQKAPTGLKASAPASRGGSDGKITGVSSAMEFRSESEIYYTACTSNSIENLTSGIYYVRFRETTMLNPSPEVTVTVPVGGTETHYAYLNGYTDGTFRPNAFMTRGEVAVMFYNLTGGSTTASAGFSDVPSGAWYADAINALANKNIISGYADGTFRPDATITRSEFVVLAVKYAGALSAGDGISFTDVPANAWFHSSIKTASSLKWISGYNDGAFRPDNAIARCEVTAVVNKMLKRTPDKDFINSKSGNISRFADVTAAHWAFYDIIEATANHSAFVSGGTEEWSEMIQ